MTRGRLAIVLHTHMPYVEGFGTWPFGEEWLWEAVATSYLPLLDVLEAADGRLTLSLTPVLCDQLEAPGARDRCERFLREIRPESHARDARAHTRASAMVLRAIDYSAGRYAWAADRLAALGDGGLLAALGARAAWTSSATHAILPLLATDAGVRLQAGAGVDAFRARWPDRWRGGFWLPECAYAPWLDALLVEAGVHAVCVDLTDLHGAGAAAHLRPLRTSAGVVLVPIDRAVLELVWSPRGYPSGGAYRDTHKLTEHRHQAWAVDGAPYAPERAIAQARADARDFVARAAARVAGGGVSVCALDTELLGHWWHEGPAWLRFVLEEAAAAGLELCALDDVLADIPLAAPPACGLPVSTWGTPRDLSTWAGPPVASLAREQRAAELALLAAGGAAVPERAARELLALQSSDWAFLITHATAGTYPRERADGHAAAVRAALAGDGAEPALRNLAPHLRRSWLAR